MGAEQNQKDISIRNLEQETQTWPNQPKEPEKEKKKTCSPDQLISLWVLGFFLFHGFLGIHCLS